MRHLAAAIAAVTVVVAEPSADPCTPAAAAVLDGLAVSFVTATTTMTCRGVTGGRSHFLFRVGKVSGALTVSVYRGCDIQNKNEPRPVFFFFFC